MPAQQFYLLPTRLAGARRRRGMPQKVAAATIGVAQSVLCALEKGRRRPLDAAVLHRLGDAYGLNDDERDELAFAAAHDQLLLSVRGLNLDRYAELISAVLQAGRSLRPAEAHGLALKLSEIERSKRQIDGLSRLGAVADGKEGPAM